jgi:hypothetical protein
VNEPSLQRSCTVVLVALVALAACGGSNRRPDLARAIDNPDGGAADGDGSDGLGESGGDPDAIPDVPVMLPHGDADPVPDVHTLDDLISQPLPAGVAAPKLIVPGDARLVGWIGSACTSGVPASGNGDRWCGFRRPAGPADSGSPDTELWVINVTAAAAGAVPPCDGTSPNCLRLSSKLWTDEVLAGPSQDIAHRFDGDTLIFTAGGSSGTEGPYVGPIWAWRPGWPAARQLTAAGLTCYGHARAATAQCVTNIKYDGFSPRELDITAGSIADAQGGPELPLVAHATVYRKDSQRSFWTTMTDAGDAVIYSAPRAENPATASLRVVPIGVPGGPAPVEREVLPDVMNWALSNDQAKVYYLANYGTDRLGALMMADFPSGANPVQMSRKTGRFVILGEDTTEDRGIGYFIEGTGRFLSEYRFIPKRSEPFNSTVVFRYAGNLEGFRPSRDLRYTGYAKVDRNEGFNGYIARNDGSGDCILSSQRDLPAFTMRFLDSAGLVFWAEESDDDATFRDGWRGRPDGCRDKHRFAAHLAYHAAVGDEGLIFGDQADIETETMTLRYVKIENGQDWPAAGPVAIMERVVQPVVMLTPQRQQLVFRVKGLQPEASGLYVFSGLPFGAPSSAVDAAAAP